MTDTWALRDRIALFVAVACAAGCSSRGVDTLAPPPSAARPSSSASQGPTVRPTTLEAVGLDASILDRSVDPCDDFYRFACGSWLERTKLPDDQAVWTRSFSVMAEATETNVRTMLERFANPENGASVDASETMLGDFYASCMDETTIDGVGTTPIDDLLARIDRVKTREQLGALLYDLHSSGVYALVRLEAQPDRRDPGKIVGAMWKNGWELSHAEYEKSEPHGTTIRQRYEETLKALLDASPSPQKERERRVRNTIAIETLLSEKTAKEASDVERWRDAKRWTQADLEREAPDFPWKAYLQASHLDANLAFDVADPLGVKRISEVMQHQSVEALRDYVYVRTLFDLTYLLGRPMRQARFALRSARWGMKTARPRWRDCVRTTQYTLGQSLVTAYARTYHFDKNDPRVLAMIDDIHGAWEERLAEVAWLDDATRSAALEKLRAMTFHVGYPDQGWAEPIRVDRKTFAANTLTADRSRRAYDLSKIGGPIDPDGWSRSPLEANAYHDHERNSIFVHMAMLMPPIYAPLASVPVQYGSLGMTIGHEFAHGFDHYGSGFDARGAVRDWWSDATKAEFEKRKTCFVDQFSTYDIFPDLKVNGKLSVGENIADVAGLRMAFRAYRKHQEAAKERLVADGFDEDQQFFLSRAQAWCSVMSDAGARSSNESNPHIFPKWAVNGPLHHLAEFHEAFGCKLPEDVCSLW